MKILSSTFQRDAIFLAALLVLLVLFYHHSFGYPPRSDYWVALYHFHLADASPGALGWLALCNYDPWEHGTYRPLAHLLLYLEHKLFGVHFIGNRLANFFFYFLSIVFLFRLARALALDSFLSAAFLVIYAFLFSHFDIVTWTFQIFTTSSFAALLLGYLLFIRYLRTGRRGLLAAVGALFLFSMFCFELYALWPLGVVILWLTRRSLFPTPPAPGDARLLRPTVLMLSIIYALYLVVFIITRSAEQTSGELPRLTPGLALLGVGAVFFNLFYNGLLVNLAPLVTEPLVIRDNLDMAGILIGWYDALPVILPWAAGGGTALIALAYWGLRRKGNKRTLLILSFLFFLYFVYFFTVSVSRLTTNFIWYPFTQFRYQYIANALLVLMAITVMSELIRPKRLGKIVTACFLLPLLAINMQYIRKYMIRIEDDLKPLNQLLTSIRSGIETGKISPQDRLFIDDGIAGFLPPLCWNEDMGRYMKGTYQWYFPRDRIDCFTFNRSEAAWVILPRDELSIESVPSGERAADAKQL